MYVYLGGTSRAGDTSVHEAVKDVEPGSERAAAGLQPSDRCRSRADLVCGGTKACDAFTIHPCEAHVFE